MTSAKMTSDNGKRQDGIFPKLFRNGNDGEVGGENEMCEGCGSCGSDG